MILLLELLQHMFLRLEIKRRKRKSLGFSLESQARAAVENDSCLMIQMDSNAHLRDKSSASLRRLYS